MTTDNLIKEGQPFPQFSLHNQDGQLKHNADYKNRWLIVYVYPKDDTPGCTIQGRNFSATRAQFEQLGAEVVGLSADDVSSHKDFCDKFAFQIDLLADPQAKLLSQLGLTQSEFKGQFYWPRTTFLIDPTGLVRKVYTGVKPDGHEKEVLEDLRRAQSH
jgi:thioredoxin-dependent peroxiredoxin